MKKRILISLLVGVAYSCNAQLLQGYNNSIITFHCHQDTCISNEMSDDRKIAKISDIRECMHREEINPMKELFGGVLYGYADSTGKIIIPFQFEFAEPFRDNYAVVSDTERCSGYAVEQRMHHIKRDGQSLYRQRFSQVYSYINGYAIVEEKGNFDFYHIDTLGRRIYQQKYLRLTPYSKKGYALGQKALSASGLETWALIDTKGKELIIKRVQEEAEIFLWFKEQGY